MCPSIKIDIDTSYRLDSVDQYALEIVNYSLVGQFHSPDTFHCVPVCEPISTAFVGLELSPPVERFAEWKLVEEVSLVQVDFPIIPDEPVCYIDRQYLGARAYRPYTCSTGSTPQCRYCFIGDRTEGGIFAYAEDFEVKSLGSIRVTSPKLSSLFQQRNTWASIDTSRSHYLLLEHTQTNTSKHVLDKF